MTEFELIEFAESPRAFHAREIPSLPAPQIWLNTITEPALVLGSTQRDESIVHADTAAGAGVDIVRRRSGGGAVLLRPGEVTWFDVIIPADGPGWAIDVHEPMRWLGGHLASLLSAALGPSADVAMHDGPLVSTAHSRLLCFDGLGPGEVVVDGAKLVGISQRRTRNAARLQCCWYQRYDPHELLELLAPAVRPPADELQSVATVDRAVSERVVAGLVARLSS